MAKPAPSSESKEQTIEQLQERYQSLNKKKIQAETQRDGAKNRLDELKGDARSKYGTDDVEQLQAKLDEIIAENARKRSVYQQELDKIESELAAVEAKFSEANATSGSGGTPRR
jgi:chromosome segregation ATPase